MGHRLSWSLKVGPIAHCWLVYGSKVLDQLGPLRRSNLICPNFLPGHANAVTEAVVYETAESPGTNDSEDDAECISTDGCNCRTQIQNARNGLLRLSDIADDTTPEGK
ncbi:hypothetical protein ACN38_g10241 [Penicillium nordicum]|uniref:Uncharacterized protein n=1 Tax=Penicillium nordicum TaxID=229535 RepID=A0A0N0RXX0_9EURO|nr:hypothetical protein ACN38_g10241 [Penicillium nordicum]